MSAHFHMFPESAVSDGLFYTVYLSFADMQVMLSQEGFTFFRCFSHDLLRRVFCTS